MSWPATRSRAGFEPRMPVSSATNAPVLFAQGAGQQGAVTTQGEVRIDALLEGVQAKLVQPRGGGRCAWPNRDAAIDGAAPERQGGGQAPGELDWWRRAGEDCRDLCLELSGIDLGR